MHRNLLSNFSVAALSRGPYQERPFPSGTAYLRTPLRSRSAWQIFLQSCSARGIFLKYGIAVLCLALLCPEALHAEEKQHDPGKLVLHSARRAYNDKDYTFAAFRFREFITKYSTHPKVLHGKFGLGLTLVDAARGAEQDYSAAVSALTEVAKAGKFLERPLGVYYLGLAYRGLGDLTLAKAKAAGDKGAAHLATASNHFVAAAGQFQAAAEAFKKGAKAPPDNKTISSDWQWVARSNCEQLDALQRAGKVKEALAAAEALLAQAWVKRSRFYDLAQYYRGFASFQSGNYAAVIDSLSTIRLFSDITFRPYGDHAHYLLGRSHHLSKNQETALDAYELVISRYEKSKKEAEATLKKPDALKDKPEKQAALEALLKSPEPEHVERSRFYRCAILFEGRENEKALEALNAFIESNKESLLLPDALLRKAVCLWNLKKYPECIEILKPLAEKPPRIADEAQLWMGKAQLSTADKTKPEAYTASLKAAMDSFNKALAILKPLTATDPKAKQRQTEITIHLADTQMLAKNYKDAAANYQQLLAAGAGAGDKRSEQLLYRQATTLHLAGQFKESDALCAKFLTSYPESVLLPQVRFRMAENSFFQAAALEKSLPPETKDRDAQIKKAFQETAGRYQLVVDKHPNFEHANLARLGLGASLYRTGTFKGVDAILAPIPTEQMKGELAQAPILRANSLIQLAPAEIQNDEQRAKLHATLDEAIKLLAHFIASNPKSDQIPDAYVKMGLCNQLKAEQIQDEEQRKTTLKIGEETYGTLISKFANHALIPQATVEKAKCMIAAGNFDGGIAELKKFVSAPLNASPLAPFAMLRQGMALRAAGKPEDAITHLAAVRKQYEAALLKGDETRKEWAILLHFQHGLALKDSNKYPEAKALMEDFMKRYPGRPETLEASLRIGQALVVKAKGILDSAVGKLSKADLSAEDRMQARTERQTALLSYQSSAKYFKQMLVSQANQPDAPLWPRVHYELAWCFRPQAEIQIASVRESLLADAKRAAAREGKPEDEVEVPLSKVPVQPAEGQLVDQYKIIIQKWPEASIAIDARFELAEHYSRRGQHPEAIPLLTTALTKPIRTDLKIKTQFLLGAALHETKKFQETVPQFEEVIKNVNSPLAPHAALRAGESLLLLKAFDKAAAKFQLFIDQKEFQNVPDLSDRGLLRLAFAQGKLAKHPDSQKTCDLMISRFPKSLFIYEAQFMKGEALLAQKQFDASIQAYEAVVAVTDNEFAARAQIQIGICRMEKKLYAEAVQDFLKVIYTYNYANWKAAALSKAANASLMDKKTGEAKKYLKQIATEFPDTEFAVLAKEQLSKLP